MKENNYLLNSKFHLKPNRSFLDIKKTMNQKLNRSSSSGSFLQRNYKDYVNKKIKCLNNNNSTLLTQANLNAMLHKFKSYYNEVLTMNKRKNTIINNIKEDNFSKEKDSCNLMSYQDIDLVYDKVGFIGARNIKFDKDKEEQNILDLVQLKKDLKEKLTNFQEYERTLTFMCEDNRTKLLQIEEKTNEYENKLRTLRRFKEKLDKTLQEKNEKKNNFNAIFMKLKENMFLTNDIMNKQHEKSNKIEGVIIKKQATIEELKEQINSNNRIRELEFQQYREDVFKQINEKNEKKKKKQSTELSHIKTILCFNIIQKYFLNEEEPNIEELTKSIDYKELNADKIIINDENDGEIFNSATIYCDPDIEISSLNPITNNNSQSGLLSRTRSSCHTRTPCLKRKGSSATTNVTKLSLKELLEKFNNIKLTREDLFEFYYKLNSKISFLKEVMVKQNRKVVNYEIAKEKGLKKVSMIADKKFRTFEDLIKNDDKFKNFREKYKLNMELAKKNYDAMKYEKVSNTFKKPELKENADKELVSKSQTEIKSESLYKQCHEIMSKNKNFIESIMYLIKNSKFKETLSSRNSSEVTQEQNNSLTGRKNSSKRNRRESGKEMSLNNNPGKELPSGENSKREGLENLHNSLFLYSSLIDSHFNPKIELYIKQLNLLKEEAIKKKNENTQIKKDEIDQEKDDPNKMVEKKEDINNKIDNKDDKNINIKEEKEIEKNLLDDNLLNKSTEHLPLLEEMLLENYEPIKIKAELVNDKEQSNNRERPQSQIEEKKLLYNSSNLHIESAIQINSEAQGSSSPKNSQIDNESKESEKKEDSLNSLDSFKNIEKYFYITEPFLMPNEKFISQFKLKSLPMESRILFYLSKSKNTIKILETILTYISDRLQERASSPIMSDDLSGTRKDSSRNLESLHKADSVVSRGTLSKGMNLSLLYIDGRDDSGKQRGKRRDSLIEDKDESDSDDTNTTQHVVNKKMVHKKTGLEESLIKNLYEPFMVKTLYKRKLNTNMKNIMRMMGNSSRVKHTLDKKDQEIDNLARKLIIYNNPKVNLNEITKETYNTILGYIFKDHKCHLDFNETINNTKSTNMNRSMSGFNKSLCKSAINKNKFSKEKYKVLNKSSVNFFSKKK